MSADNMKQGAFGWNELMTGDPEAATAFYGPLFGWQIEDGGIEGMDYKVIKVDGAPVGGIMNFPSQCPVTHPVWGAYITVDDVDATAAKVTELGGKVMQPPTDIPQVGRFCVFQDPQGATLCAITYPKT